MEERMIARLAYDGNYQRAIELLLDIVVKQEQEIEKLKDILWQNNIVDPSENNPEQVK